MVQSIRDYFANMTDAVGRAWNRWWFTPGDAAPLAALRIVLGLVTFYWLLTLSPDLELLFGEHSLAPSDVVWQLGDPRDPGNYSYLHWLGSRGALWTAHVAAMLVTVLFTVGFRTRITNVLTLIALLAYVHRAPMITGILEPVLAFALFYLCFAPSGRHFSWQAWRRAKHPANESPPRTPTVSANIATRLLQLHVALVYVMMGVTMISSPNQSWWIGDAMWFLLARPESRLVDLTWMDDHTYLLNLWTHGVVVYEFAFALFVWNRWARPVLLLAGIGHWGLLALVSGQAPFCLTMLGLNLVFVSSLPRESEPRIER